MKEFFMKKNRVLLAGMLAFALVLGMAACDTGGGNGGGGSSSGGGDNPFIGTWKSSEGRTIVCKASTWDVKNIDGHTTNSGTYTRNGNTGTFTDKSSTSYGTATVSGKTLTVTVEGETYIYLKQ
jgi:hypothetical protein